MCFCCLYQLPVSPLNEYASGAVDTCSTVCERSERFTASRHGCEKARVM
jgi:hypothetical protein